MPAIGSVVRVGFARLAVQTRKSNVSLSWPLSGDDFYSRDITISKFKQAEIGCSGCSDDSLVYGIALIRFHGTVRFSFAFLA